MPNTKDTVEILNDLIQINNDRIEGYEKAIKETKPEDEDLKVLYASMIAESHRAKIALATEVQSLGAEVEQGTTTSGKIYRACEAGEDAAQKAYRTALESDELPAYIRELISRQQLALKDSHDEIKALRDQYAKVL
jgi:hypothetical protein